MNTISKRISSVLLLCLMSFALPQKKKMTVYLIGDSTMADKRVQEYPETGWGMPFHYLFDSSRVTVDNRAMNGRSTGSFIAEGRWDAVMDRLQEGDYVLIQFGHNDEVPTKNTYTPPDKFKANLEKFVADARSRGAFPVLITPVARRRFDSLGQVAETHPLYAALVREVAAARNVPLIDLDKKSEVLLQSFGPDNSRYLFDYLAPGENPHYPEGREDNTHFNEYGARRIAELVLQGIEELRLPLAGDIASPLAAQPAQGWGALPALLKRIVPPSFPARSFSIADYGAKAGGKADCLPAVRKAIAACHDVGGGHVIIPAGIYLVKGPIHLLSNVDLHLEEGAVVRFSTDPQDYLPVVLTRFEGMELMNYSPLVYAYGQWNIAVTGKGILDGQADNDHWWNWVGAKRFGWQKGMPAQHDKGNEPALIEMAAEGVPVEKRVFGDGHYMRPAFLEFYHCENILVQGVTIRNTPFWILHPTLSRNITIDGVTTISHGPNNDGCDPESCTDVLIKNCFFSNGDDCIAIKSGRNEDGRRINVPSKNIIVENCRMEDGHCGVGIGSETSGGIENVYAQDCEMSSPNLDRAIRIKSNACRGGVLKNFYFRNISVGEVKEAVVKINMFYGNEQGSGCHYPPSVSNVDIGHITSGKSGYALYMEGGKDEPVSHISIHDCSFENVAKENVVQGVQGLEIKNTTINGKMQ